MHRRIHRPHRSILRSAAFVSLVLLPLAATAVPAAAQDCAEPASRVAALLAGSGESRLPLTATFALDPAALDAGRLEAAVALEVPAAVGDVLCVAIVAFGEEETVTVHRRRLELASPAGVAYGAVADLPETAEQVLVVVEDAVSGRWAVTVADEAEEAPARPAGAVGLGEGAWVWTVVGGTATSAAADPDAGRPFAGGAAMPVVVRLVPPREQPAAGSTRFAALATSDAVTEVVFTVDGREAGRDGRRPFVARLDLDRPAREQTVRVVALGADGAVLGSDEVVVNRVDVPFRVAIRELRRDVAAGGHAVTVAVSVPAGAELARVEVYRGTGAGEELVVARTSPPPVLEAVVPGLDPAPEEWVRVAAFLADGTSIDAVELLAAPGTGEELEVNLVELHVVVTDAAGRAVTGLGRDDFTIVTGTERRPVEELAFADDVPLVLGLVVDTSGSMELLMADTRKAAVKFLGQTVTAADRAFVVDFAREPRLRHPTSGDVVSLMQSLSTLVAEGTTAIYDAIVFSLLQFDEAPEAARRALVVLSDGDDRESRMGPKDIVEHGRQLGVPVYVIGLGALDDLRRVYPKAELRRLTGDTGGRLWFVDSFAELDGAYATIRDELRSQYTLRFYTDRDLTDEERRGLGVEVAQPGVEVRTVVGARRRP